MLLAIVDCVKLEKLVLEVVKKLLVAAIEASVVEVTVVPAILVVVEELPVVTKEPSVVEVEVTPVAEKSTLQPRP